MAYWIKFSYEREIHVVDLDQISAFVYAPNGRLTFWLPESSIPVVLTPQSNPEAHCAVLDYLKQRTTYFPRSTWIRMPYDRSEYYIDLSRISAFSFAPNGRISFCLPAGGMTLALNAHNCGDGYQVVMDYIQKTTGHSLP